MPSQTIIYQRQVKVATHQNVHKSGDAHPAGQDDLLHLARLVRQEMCQQLDRWTPEQMNNRQLLERS